MNHWHITFCTKVLASPKVWPPPFLHESREDEQHYLVLDGPFQEYNKMSGTVWKGTLKDGYREGVWKAYHKNGQLAYTMPLAKGMICGDIKSYDEDGQLTDTETDAVGWGWSWPTPKSNKYSGRTFQEQMALRKARAEYRSKDLTK